MNEQKIRVPNSSRSPLGTGTRYLAFSLNEEHFAIPLLSVREVIALPDITPIPFTPNYFLGLMNLRGQVISVIDMRIKLGIKPQSNPETAVIICDLGSFSIGIVVDSVNNVLSPMESEISEKPAMESKNSEYITGIFRKDDHLVLLIDIVKSLGLEALKIAENQSSK